MPRARGAASRAVWAVAVGAVLAAGAAGCSGDEDPPASRTSTTSMTSGASATTSASPTTSSPTIDLPPEATKHTEEGAQAFAQYYWEQVSEMLVTNDASTVKAMNSPACSACSAFTDIAKKRKAEGVHSEERSYRIKIVRTVTGGEDKYTISVAGEEVPVKNVNDAGEVVKTSDPGVFSWATTVTWSSSWLVESVKAER